MVDLQGVEIRPQACLSDSDVQTVVNSSWSFELSIEGLQKFVKKN